MAERCIYGGRPFVGCRSGGLQGQYEGAYAAQCADGFAEQLESGGGRCSGWVLGVKLRNRRRELVKEQGKQRADAALQRGEHCRFDAMGETG